MMLKTIAEETWFYILEHDDETDEYFLDVACGTVAIYTIKTKLNEEEVKEYRTRFIGVAGKAAHWAPRPIPRVAFCCYRAVARAGAGVANTHCSELVTPFLRSLSCWDHG